MTAIATDSLYQIAGAVIAVTILQLLLVTNAVELSKESRRRIQHATTGQLMIGVSFILPLHVCTAALFAGIALLLYVYNFQNAWYKKTFGPLLRPSEQDKLPGAFWFLVGTWITVMLVCVVGVIDVDIGRYAILCLSYADPMAAWIGSSMASPRVFGTKATLAGCSAAFVTACVIGTAVLGTGDRRALEIGIGALACTVAECVPLGNDNLLIPIGTAVAVQLVRMHC
ncbi:dolichyl monophosphate biosynthetic process [Fragilaria crotonensis]|nr:dolichyl monophosphate biosynthetic process [Fragilaria crotonensis]